MTAINGFYKILNNGEQERKIVLNQYIVTVCVPCFFKDFQQIPIVQSCFILCTKQNVIF